MLSQVEPGQADAAIELEHLTVTYGDRVALDDVTLRIEPGHLVGIIGPNGAGKSTLLKTLLGSLRPARGSARVLGREPVAGVDAASGETILGLLRELARAGHTVLMSTHDLNVAAATCDRLLLLNRRLTGYGRPDEVFNPEVLGRTYGQPALVFSTPAM